MSKVEKTKLQHHVPAGLVSALDALLRAGKDPTLPTLADGLTFCLEVGIKELAKKNASEEGLYIAELSAKNRRMDLEEKVREMEYRTNGFVARDFTRNATVSPIRKVDEG